MLRFRLTTEFQPRTKNGQPAHRMTGVPRTSSVQRVVRSPRNSRTDAKPDKGSHRQDQKRDGQHRTDPETASESRLVRGLGPSSPVGTPIGSSAMPQIGQVPGPSCTISGCIGQVNMSPMERFSDCFPVRARTDSARVAGKLVVTTLAAKMEVLPVVCMGRLTYRSIDRHAANGIDGA